MTSSDPELPTQRAEDVAQRDIGILMALCGGGIAAGGEMNASWQFQSDTKRVKPALAMAMAGALDAHFAGGDAAIALFKRRHFALNAPPQEVRGLYAFKNDVQGGFHECLTMFLHGGDTRGRAP